jgi:hypothetical protein
VRALDRAVRISVPGVVVLLLCVALDAAAQGFGESPAAGSMPRLALGLSSAGVRALNEEFDDDLRTLNSFSFGGGRRADQSTVGSFERPKPWMLYGRVGVLNFQDELDPSRSEGARITLKRTGPKLTGHYYVGIHRTF